MESASAKRKRSKAYYGGNKAKRKKYGNERQLGAGMRGVLITTGDQDKFCIPEAYNLLNEYGDKLYGPESTSADDSDSQDEPKETGAADIASAVAEEVAKLKGSEEQPRRFQAVHTGTKHVVFIRCNDPVDPCQLVHHMLMDVSASGVRKSRYCQRIVPVVKVCHATVEDIKKNAVSVLEPHFHTDDLAVHKFAVSYKARNNKDVNRDDIIRLLASMVTREGDFSHVVDLNNADFTVIVEIIKNLCCLSVVKDFNKLKKYNIHSIVHADVQTAETSNSKPVSDSAGQAQKKEDKEEKCATTTTATTKEEVDK